MQAVNFYLSFYNLYLIVLFIHFHVTFPHLLWPLDSPVGSVLSQCRTINHPTSLWFCWIFPISPFICFFIISNIIRNSPRFYCLRESESVFKSAIQLKCNIIVIRIISLRRSRACCWRLICLRLVLFNQHRSSFHGSFYISISIPWQESTSWQDFDPRWWRWWVSWV